MDPASPAPAAPPAPPRRSSKQLKIGLGLLLTLVGLFLISALLPTAPDALAYGITVGALGILAVWLGGILMGIGSRS
jgi:hypothetical protein